MSCGKVVFLGTDCFLVKSTYYGKALEGNALAPRPMTRRDEMFLPDRNVPCRDSRISTVEIRTVQRLYRSAGEAPLSAETIGVRRVDHGPPKIFPFSLPVREAAWLRITRDLPAFLPSGENRMATSPGGHLVARVGENPETFRWEAVIRNLGQDTVVRHLPLSRMGSDYFDPQVRAIGWSHDERRVFLVSAFGIDGSALLSFSVEGNEDYWEGLIDPDETGWRDGFVMKPAKAERSPN